MKQNNESPVNQITHEFADSGTPYYLEAKYLSLVTKALHDNNLTRALPDRMGCRGKAGKIAAELVYRFLNKYGLELTYNSFNSEFSQNNNINRDNGSALIDIVKLKDEENPLHELVQIMKNSERHQYHHPKLVQALMNKVPHLLNDEAKSHFNNILSRATVAKNNRDQNSKSQKNNDENFSPTGRAPQNNKNNSTVTDRSAALNQDNQITTSIQQPIVFLDEGADGESKGKPHNLLLKLNFNIKSPTNPDEQAVLELSPPMPNPSQVTATAVLLPEGDDYQKLSSSNGTNQIYNEEEENIGEQFTPSYQDRDVHEFPNQNQNDKEYEYEYEYDVEVEEEEQLSNIKPSENENIPPPPEKEIEKKEKPKKSPKSKKSNKKPKKPKNSIDSQIQQQLDQQQLIIQKLQELNQAQQQQQLEQQQKFQQQLQQQELQQQQLQQLLQEQQHQQEQIQQQLKQEQEQKLRQSSSSKSNTSQVSDYTYSENSQEKSENSEASYNDNTAHSKGNKLDASEASMTSVADFIDDQTNVKKRGMETITNALDNLLKNKKQVIDDDDESTVIIPIERKPQLQIEAFSMPEVPFNENSQYYSDLTENDKNSYSEYSNYSYYSKANAKDAISEYSNYSNINEKEPNIEDLENAQERDEILDDQRNDEVEEEKFEPSLSQATSIAEKEYPNEVIRSIKNAFSPQKEKEDSFATSATAAASTTAATAPTASRTDYYYSAYYSSDYYSEDESDDRRRKNDQKQVKFKLRINREQFERFYPNQNLSNTQTIKVSKRGLSQLQEIMSQKKDNEPLRQVIRLKTPTAPMYPPSPYLQPQPQQPQKPQRTSQKQDDPTTISVVTKGPHAGLIKRKIKKSDHQADIQKKLKEKTEYAKKLQEELERKKKEIEEQAAAAAEANNIQMNNRKLARSQPQTRTNNRQVRDRSASPNEMNRPNSAPKKRKANANHKRRDIQMYNDFDTINTSSLLPSSLSTVSEIHPELMSPKQREQKKKEIRRKIKKLNNELQQQSDPEEKRQKRAKIEAKIQQLREEFERSSENVDREPKKQRSINPNPKKFNKADPNPNFTNSPRNNVNNMTPAERRKRRNEIKLELKKLHAEFERTSSDLNENLWPVIPRRNNERDMDEIPIPQPRPRQIQQIEKRDININNNNDNAPYLDQSSYYTSYNSNSNIETNESYSQSPIQNQNKNNEINHQPKNREVDDNDENDDNSGANGSNFFSESSSLLERRNYKKMKVEIPIKNGKENVFKKHNEQENDRRKEDSRISEMEDDIDSNDYDDDDDREPVSVNGDIMKKQEYKPRKINIKKEVTNKRKNSQIEDEKSLPKVVDEKVVFKDGKKKIRRRIHIPIPQNPNKNNDSDSYNDDYEIQSNDEYDGSKKVVSKSSSKQKNASLNNDFSSEVKDGGLGQPNKLTNKEVVNVENPNNDQDSPSQFLFHINIIEAKGVPRIDSFDPCDPYCFIFVEGQNDECARRTKSMEKTSDPVWNENFEFIINNEKQKHHRNKKKILSLSSSQSSLYILNVQIKDEDLTAGDVLLSSTKIDLSQYKIGQVYDLWFDLQNDANSDENNQNKSGKSISKSNSSKGTGSNASRSGGKIHLKFEKTALLDEDDNDNDDENGNKSTSYSASNSYKNTGEKLFENQNGQKIKLHILIDQAEGLSKRNQYIVAKIKNSPEGLMKTMPINSSEPTWNESFKLKLPNPQNDILLITLRTKDEKNGDDDIGNISIPISSLTPPNSGKLVDKWYEFRSTSYSSKTKNRRGHLSSQKICGKLHLILSTEIDKDDTNSNSNYGYSNSVTPNASSNNSQYRVSSSLQKLNATNPALISKQVPNSSARHLAVQIIEARGLPSRCSPFCVVQIRDEKPIFHTRAVRPIPQPKWNQNLDFHSRKAVEDGILDISIRDKRSNKEQEIASLSLPVESLNKAKRDAIKNNQDEDEVDFVINKWFPLEPSGEIHLAIVPRMKDSPKPTILTPIDNKQVEDQYNDNVKSNDELPGIQIDASSSDIDVDLDLEFDVRNEKEKNLRRKARKDRRTSLHNHIAKMESEENRKKKILEQFPPTTSEEE